MSDATPTDPPEGTEAEEQAAKAPAASKPAAAKKPAAKAKTRRREESRPKEKAAKAKAAEAKTTQLRTRSRRKKSRPRERPPRTSPHRANRRLQGDPPPKNVAPRKLPAAKAAAPGDAAEAQEVAKAQDAEKPASKVARRAVAGVKGPSRRRVVSAHARYVRTSARKARMVCGHIRGKSIQEARAILAFTPREVARDWSKLLESAVANAESNHELLEDDLIVREAYADEGPTIKRFRPRAMGRATPIRKRTSHLTITLSPRPEPGNTKRHG